MEITMIYQLNVITQKVFFPNTKVKPNPKWEDSYMEIGEVKKVKVERDGKVISAIQISKSEKPKGIVILGHPISKKAKYFYNEKTRVEIYLKNGLDVVVFDFNGFGESDRIDLRYWKDAQAVINHFKKVQPNIPFVLHGLSFGAFHVLRAYKDLPQNSIVVLENMSRSLYDYWKRWAHTKALVRVFEKLPITAFQEMEVIEQFKDWTRSDINVLAIANEKDVFTPADEMMDAISYFKGKRSFVVLPEATHLLGPQQQYELYNNEISKVLIKFGDENESRVDITL